MNKQKTLKDRNRWLITTDFKTIQTPVLSFLTEFENVSLGKPI